MEQRNGLVEDDTPRQLHDRTTRGGALTQMRGEIAAALAHIQAETRRLQTLAEENDALRRENDALARR